jgi:light-regulated signal transduction histidine kinase (bacteriophytochrome)
MEDFRGILLLACGSAALVLFVALGVWIVTLQREIATRRRAQEDLQRHRERLEDLVRDRTAELDAANAEAQAFSYTVSHDLRGPLRAIIGYSTMLQGQATGPQEQALLGRISDNARRLGQMVDDLLEFARVGRGELVVQRFDPNALVAEVVQRAYARYPRAMVTARPLPQMVGDSDLLRLVFENLIGNALKFSANVAVPRVEIGALVTGGETAFFVRDNGAGFDMQHAEELFAVFRRLHARDEFEGSGVGLATVQRIVARHGGRIWAESAPQAGATFYFTLKST